MCNSPVEKRSVQILSSRPGVCGRENNFCLSIIQHADSRALFVSALDNLVAATEDSATTHQYMVKLAQAVHAVADAHLGATQEDIGLDAR